MKFIKMHGTGNDYVYVDCFKERVESPSVLAPLISHRRFGVGSDGLILIKPYAEGDAEMVMYNADGSISEMCGNGLRCVAKYVHDHYTKGKSSLKLMTGRGELTADIETDSSGSAEFIKINMGPPVFEGRHIPVNINKPSVFEEHITAGGRDFVFSSVSMGNPHCVIFIKDIEKFPISKFGPEIEHHPLFPARVNVEFVEIISRTELIQRTWERGSGETWACGTGASAVAVVAHHLGITDSIITIHLKGGDLKLEYRKGEPVYLKGSAVEVFTGDWPD